MRRTATVACSSLFLLVVVVVGLFSCFNEQLLTAYRSQYPIEAFFQSPLDVSTAHTLHETFRVFHEAVSKTNITYFIMCGTLLGSYRHHDRIPWDDDIDVIVNVTQRDVLKETLSRLRPDYLLYWSSWMGWQWRFYPSNGHLLYHNRFRAPYMDIFFFQENVSHVWNDNPDYPSERWPKRFVFPLRPRPFGSLMVPAPCNTRAVLEVNFDISKCQSRHFSHRVDFPFIFHPKSVPCTNLRKLFPFVFRTERVSQKGELYDMETLKLDNRTMSKILVQSHC